MINRQGFLFKNSLNRIWITARNNIYIYLKKVECLMFRLLYEVVSDLKKNMKNISMFKVKFQIDDLIQVLFLSWKHLIYGKGKTYNRECIKINCVDEINISWYDCDMPY